MGPFTRGFFVLRMRRLPVRIHWSTPVGLFVFGGLTLSPLLWLVLVGTTLVHELGHVVFVRRFRLTVVSVDLHGLGGTCRWVGPATPLQAAVIAWGGVLAQLVVVAVAVAVPGRIPGLVVAVNAYLIALNLLPFEPFDGGRAWALFHRSNLAKIFRARIVQRRP